MRHTFETEEGRKVKAVIFEVEENGEKFYEVLGVEGTTPKELEYIFAQALEKDEISKN